ncbi:MAG TPA: hypothetical protein DE109_09935 [Aeromonas sp.]|nr:hypothetical protein [Aeromonas sp.]
MTSLVYKGRIIPKICPYGQADRAGKGEKAAFAVMTRAVTPLNYLLVGGMAGGHGELPDH